MKFVLREDPFFARKMTITDTFCTSFIDEIVSKGMLMTYIATHVRCTVVYEIVKMETYVIAAQQQNSETEKGKSKNAKQKRKSKSTNHIPAVDSNDSNSDSNTDSPGKAKLLHMNRQRKRKLSPPSEIFEISVELQISRLMVWEQSRDLTSYSVTPSIISLIVSVTCPISMTQKIYLNFPNDSSFR